MSETTILNLNEQSIGVIEDSKITIIDENESKEELSAKVATVLKGNCDTNEKEIEDKLLLDGPAITMARRITQLFIEDFDVVKITYISTDSAHGEMNIYCSGPLKAYAIRSLFKDEINGCRINVKELDTITENWNKTLIEAAFYNNPIIRSVRETKTEFHTVTTKAVCDREKLLQFAADNSADYLGNSTELPADVLNYIVRDGITCSFCTEI